MPCSCDGYDAMDRADMAGKLDNEKKLRCRAQSLVHKLARALEARGGDGVPVELRDAVERERRELLAHKRAEAEADARKADSDGNKVLGRIVDIQNLGGIPTQKIRDEEKACRDEYQRLKNITDAELLG